MHYKLKVKSLISLLLSVLLVMTLLPVTARAATVSVTDEAGLKTAILNASDGDTISIDDDITVTEATYTLSVTRSITFTSANGSTLDLGGNNGSRIYISSGAEAIFSGDLKVTGSDTYVVYVWGTFTLAEEASIEQTNGDGSNYAVYNNSGGTVSITGGNIKSTKYAVHNNSGGTANITGGNIEGTFIGIANFGELAISGGNIQGSYAVSVGNGATANISGGTFTGTGATQYALSAGGTANITGGTFNGTVRTTSGTINVDTTGGNVSFSNGVGFDQGGHTRNYLSEIPDPDDMVIGSPETLTLQGVHTGVSFSIDSDDTPAGLGASISDNTITLNPTLPGEYSLVLTANAAGDDSQSLRLAIPVTVTGSVSVSVCAIGDTEYETLAAAMEAVGTGETITLLADITLNSGMVIDNKTFIFDLAGYTLNILNPSGNGLDVKNGGKLLLHEPISGELHVNAAGRGVNVVDNGSEAMVTTATGGIYGANAENNGKITVLGDCIATENFQTECGARAVSGGNITIGGKAESKRYGAYAEHANSSVTVLGDAIGNFEASAMGVYATLAGNIIVKGDVKGNSAGVQVGYGSEIIIDGTISTVDDSGIYIRIGNVNKTINDYEATTTKEGYRTYRDAATAQAFVWVKESAETYTIGSIANQIMTPLTAGYASSEQETKTITITKTGTGDLVNLATALSGANKDDFVITQPAVSTLNTGTPSTIFTVKAKGGLSAGNYTATVTVTADNMTNVSFTVTQVVNTEAVASAILSPIAGAFDKNPANQADVNTTITWNDASSVSDVKKTEASIGSSAYLVSGNTLTIKKEFLATQPTGNLVLTVEFDQGNAAELTITIQDTTQPSGSNPPAWPAGSTLTAGSTTMTGVALSWTVATDDIEVTGYRVYQGNTLLKTVTGAVYSCEVTGLSSSTTYTFRVQAGDADNNWTYGPTVTVRTDSPSDGDGGGGHSFVSEPAPEPKPTAQVLDSDGNINKTMTIEMDHSTDIASIEADADSLNTAFDKSKADGKGVKTVKVDIPAIEGARAYETILPVSFLTSEDAMKAIEIKSSIASVTLPGNMISSADVEAAQNVSLTIAPGDKGKLDTEVQSQIGDRPVIELSLKIDGKQTSWNNENAPVTVTIPYTPTEAELADTDSIVIWYIDGSGNAVCVPNGHYDPVTGSVTFATTHFSYYAVGYKKVSFIDVPEGVWYNKAVSFIAARGITTGTGSGRFSPDANLARGECLVLLMNAYGISPDANLENNFSDAGNTYYTGYLASAKRLGISTGVGNNMFAPVKEITRQEMFTLLHNTLKAIGKLPQGNSGKGLSDFTDAGQISSWSKGAMTLLVETGTIGGSNGKLHPMSMATRAEMSQVLYNLMTR